MLLKDIDDLNSFFHFTNKSNLKNINLYGLIPRIGINANNIEATKKVFFSKGKTAVLELCDVWLKWMMNNAFGPKDLYGYYKEMRFDEKRKLISLWSEEFLTREYLKDEAKLNFVFEIVYNKMKKAVYLLLDLDDSIYSVYDIDEVKDKMLKEKENKIDYYYMKEMYGSFSNVDNNKMERWNMHTLSDVGVLPDKVSLIKASNGNSDMLSVVMEIYEEKGIEYNWDILIKYISYVKRREHIYGII